MTISMTNNKLNMNHYQITAFVKAQKNKTMTQGYDQTLTKKMAREMVGDGQSPNLWYVTYGPYIAVDNGYEGYDFELIEGRDAEYDVYTQGPFASYEDALKCFDEIELDFDYGIGQAFIEDRECGTVTEKWLRKKVKVVYEQDEYDNSKVFYEKAKQTKS